MCSGMTLWGAQASVFGLSTGTGQREVTEVAPSSQLICGCRLADRSLETLLSPGSERLDVNTTFHKMCGERESRECWLSSHTCDVGTNTGHSFLQPRATAPNLGLRDFLYQNPPVKWEYLETEQKSTF